jgi:hypothetical protein
LMKAGAAGTLARPTRRLLVPFKMSNSGTRPIVLAARSSSPHPEVRAERASKDEGEAPQLHPSRLSAARRAPQDEVNSNRSRDAGASELRSRRSARRKSAHDPEKCCPVFGLRSCATKKGGEAPKDACHPVSAPFLPEGRGCGSDPSQTSLRGLRNLSACGTARLPALRCGACPGERTPELSPGRASRETRCEGVTSA